MTHRLALTSTIGGLDASIVCIYLIAVVAIGVAAGFLRKKGNSGQHYFLADNSLRWPMIGLAMFAANISTVHLVSLAESAYKYGLVFGNFEWMAGFTLILLSLFFAPLYLRSRVTTLPDYMERRFNRACRDWLAVVSIVSAIVLHIGVALYTAAWVLRGIAGMPPNATILGIDSLMFFIIALGLLTGIYTMVGGLLAVVWTESIQTVLLLIGAACVTVVGYNKVGGWDALSHTLATQPHPLANVADAANQVTWGTGNFLTMLRPSTDPSGMPWYAIFLGYPVIGIWYWCCDQTIVQRVLAAKNESHARLGPLFCAALKILPVFLFVLPGTICLALVQQNAFGGDAPATATDTYTFMITHLVPVGLKGLVVAAMLAAAMQTCSAALNSTATLFAYDIVKRWRPATTDVSLVRTGRVVTVVATLIAIVISPIFGHYQTIFQGINSMIAYLAPPITTVFLVGVFWKRASGKAAFLTLVVGGLLGLGVFAADWCGVLHSNFMISSFLLMALCFLVMIPASFLWPEQLRKEAEPLVWDHWSDPLRGGDAAAGFFNYKTVSAAVCAGFILLYSVFG